jgi:hypothetical protein
MRSSFETDTETQVLYAIAWFCYSASLAALFATGYSLVSLAVSVTGQQIGAIYSLHSM